MAILVANDGSRFVETIAERNAIPVAQRFMGMRVSVKDATSDPKFGGGTVQYQWDLTVAAWTPVWSERKSDLKFTTENKTIVGGKVTTEFVIKDDQVWCARVVDLSGVILGDAQLTVSGKELSINTQDYNGMFLHYTYAYGSMTEELNDIWASKASLESPTLTGDPKAPTKAAGSNDTSIATTEFVSAAVADIPTGIAEAPVDGKNYGRKDEAWTEIVIDLDTAKLKSSLSTAGTLAVDATTQQAYQFTNTAAGTRSIGFADGPQGYMVTSALVINGNAGDITFTGTNLKWTDNKVIAKADLGAARTVLLFLWDGTSTWIGSKGPAY